MKNILITGATSGIGLETARLLCDTDKVYAVGRDTSKPGAVSDNYIPVSFDLSKTERLPELYDTLKKAGMSCPDVIIFSAGVASYGLHESVPDKEISAMTRTNLESPMLMSGRYLPGMKQRGSGHIIFISSVTANEASPHAAAYGATKAALSAFSESLFQESRKHGIRITCIEPDLTGTALYRNADFSPDPDACLLPEQIAKAVKYIIDSPPGTDVTSITIRPQYNRIIKKQGG